MIRRWFYVICPNAKLKSYLKNLAEDSISSDILAETHLWSRNMDRINPIISQDQLKIVFLANILYETKNISDIEFRETVVNLLGVAPFTIQKFDEWWELIVIESDANSFEIGIQEIGSDIFSQFKDDGNNKAVEKWLNSLSVNN